MNDNDIKEHMDEIDAAKEVFGDASKDAPTVTVVDSEAPVDKKMSNVPSAHFEAPIVWFTNYRNGDGFEESITLRGYEIREVYTRRREILDILKKNNCTPVTRGKSGVSKPEPKIVPDRKCPKCGSDVVESRTKAGKPFHKCSTQKYSNGQVQGCDWVDWLN